MTARSGTTTRSSADSDRLASVVSALSDPACREILRHLDEPKTAAALSETCDVSTSTLYRKIDALTEADLVEERIAIEPDYSHSTRYACCFDEIVVSIEDVRNGAFRSDERRQ